MEQKGEIAFQGRFNRAKNVFNCLMAINNVIHTI